LWWCCKGEEGDGNCYKMMVLQRRRRQWHRLSSLSFVVMLTFDFFLS
jgi:hypothetical protein